MTPARRKERLRDLAKALDGTRRFLLKASQDTVGVDLHRQWDAKISASRFLSEIGQLTNRLTTFSTVAKTAANAIQTKRGAPPGSGLLSAYDVLALCGVYARFTGENSNLGKGPFADFVEGFLVAAGYSQATANDYVVEMLHYLRAQLNEENRQLGIPIHSQFIAAHRNKSTKNR